MRVLVAHGVRLVMACGFCVGGEYCLSPSPGVVRGILGLRARVVLRLSGCPLLVPPCGWPNARRGSRVVSDRVPPVLHLFTRL